MSALPTRLLATVSKKVQETLSLQCHSKFIQSNEPMTANGTSQTKRKTGQIR